jgi:hypothetical protein
LFHLCYQFGLHFLFRLLYIFMWTIFPSLSSLNNLPSSFCHFSISICKFSSCRSLLLRYPS